jgi:transcription initiation factor TFIID TATA-box-binding protein
VKKLTSKYTIVNVVATATLDKQVDLELLRQQLPKHVIWDQDIYGGRVAYYKTEEMEGKVSIFWSGKLISVGTKSVEKAFQELQQTAKALNAKLKTEPRVQNIIATTTLKTEKDIDQIISELTKDGNIHVIYEPEQFPAAIIKMPINQTAKATMLLFSSGKLVCVGLTKTEQIKKAIETLKSKLET